MDIIQALALAVLQGLTEFLPISSSAHLILLPELFGWQDQGLAFDIAVHVGTLSAVVGYYRKELWVMSRAWFESLQGQHTANSRLVYCMVLGTIPVGLVGISLSDAVTESLRSPLVIAAATLIFGVLLGYADKYALLQRAEITLKDALIVGLMQAIALIPGTSRSGITMTAGLLMGLEKEVAARFSFLLSIPVIALAGLLKGLELFQSKLQPEWDLMIIGVAVSALVAYLTIGWFLSVLEKLGMLPFVVYRLILSIFLVAVFLG
jgi:undecaprenyl-diphosphatase